MRQRLNRVIARVSAGMMVAGLLLATTRCSSAEDAVRDGKREVCNAIESLDTAEVRRRVEDAQRYLEGIGVRVTAETWTQQGKLLEYVNKVREYVGCDALTADGAALSDGTSAQALHHGGPPRFCGPGHGLLGFPGVAACLNTACERHDACYARCSKPTGLLCMWASETDTCDQDFFNSVESWGCSFPFGTKIASWAVYLAARGLKLAPGTGLTCAAGMTCPSGDVAGQGPCANDFNGAACKTCLDAKDPGRGCLAQACRGGEDPCVNDNCAGAASETVCYAANCPDVAECFGSAVRNECTAGETRPCTCMGGKSGTQQCSLAGGSWGACNCSCTPMCAGKACGANDGCGGTCLTGSCPAGQTCNAGVCKTGPCSPVCTGKACGAPDGCGGTCATGTCSAGFTCSAGSCTLDPSSRWTITVTTGSIPVDGGWNTFSAPDAMVCLWIAGKRTCTADSGDTLTPAWGCEFPAMTASTLMAGIDVEMFDNDRFGAGTCGEVLTSEPGEAICTRGTVKVTAANFASRTWGAGCLDSMGGTRMSFNAKLTPL